ncbi:disease resistance protein RPS5-like isoform X2 [Macadamia integrifolia]|nr:disease resistance protein RPS5-like isoform X2 [Macadamia integrifolia]
MNYLGSSSANVNGLQTVVQNLKARRNDEKSTLKAAENAGRVMTDVASNWFRSIHEIELEADAIEKEYNQGRCAGGWCVNCWSRYKLSKMSIELSLKAESRLNDQFVVARQPSPKSVIEIESEPIEIQPSTQQLLLKMLDCIGDPEIGIIGVYGMGGVGKTTLAGKVNNHYKVNSCFETVIMVSVSATPNIRSIQTSISKRIGLDLSNDNEDDAREKLFDALRKKKFLLILDDVWRRLELKDIGIPHPRNQHKGSKLLVTSRSQDACTDMGARKTIKVEPLSKDESWNLFIEKAGQHVAANHLKCFAEKIVGRCKGLPLAIVTVARAMANRHGVGEWMNAAREMEQSATDLRGMKEEVFVPLKFSFDRLEDDMLRSLFLYCACFPEDYNIGKDEIVNYCVGEGFADRLGSLTAARNKCEALIGSLKIACLLEDGEDEGSVRMHDMIRELALGITSSDSDSSPKFLIRTGESFKEAPKASEWLHATRISLMHTQIKEFPQLVGRCQKLVTLLLSYNRILTVPPTNFLQHMEGLSVLDLSYTYTLEYLPDSLSCLVNLRVLRLRGCSSLRALPALEMLQQLQVLDLSYCQMLDQQIFGSECMGCISNLRYFDWERPKFLFQQG